MSRLGLLVLLFSGATFGQFMPDGSIDWEWWKGYRLQVDTIDEEMRAFIEVMAPYIDFSPQPPPRVPEDDAYSKRVVSVNE